MKFKQLSYEEMFVIEKMYEKGVGIREIGEFLGRSPNTISYEIKEKSVNGIYTAQKAWVKKLQKRWRAKSQCLKVSLNSFLTKFVETKLEEKWSPKQISGYLREELSITCSSKAVYKFTESRGLDHLLFWGWNNHRGGRKRSHPKTIHMTLEQVERLDRKIFMLLGFFHLKLVLV
jgi:IS30 family transposase